MKLLTRDTDYAVRALCYIAKHKGSLITAKELVSKLKVPRPFLRKILQTLNKKRIIKSYKGQGGGFELNVSARKINLIDLIKVFQGPFELNEHIFKGKACPHINKCKLKKKLDNIERYVESQLEDIKLGSLL